VLRQRTALPALLAAVALVAGCNHGDAVPAADGPVRVGVAEIQGNGAASPLDERVVSVDGVVSGDFQGRDRLGGFFLLGQPDDDDRTSDGIFVFDGDGDVDVEAGDAVEVTGTVTERFGETQVVASNVVVRGRAELVVTDVTLPATGLMTNSDGIPIADLERYEGMLVRFPQPLTVTRLNGLERYGEVALASGGRSYVFTNLETPDPERRREYDAAISAREIMLDDGRRDQNVAPVRFLDAGRASGTPLRLGDTIAGLTGNLRFSRGAGPSGVETWRVIPAADPHFEATNSRPGRPAIPGRLKVAAYNLGNYFSTIDTGADNCGPRGDDGCRGADSREELERQTARIAAALDLLDADIVGLVELENNASASLERIVKALGAKDYAFIDTGTIGDDAIKVGLLYRSDTVSPDGGFAILDDAVDRRYNDARNRPVLAQTFTERATRARLTVAVAHLKSKGSDCDAEDDPDRGDGQGNCSGTRTQAARIIADWLAGSPTGDPGAGTLLVGDLNAYLEEDPIAALEAAGLVNLVDDNSGYSFVFRGRAGMLDYAFASPSLAAQVRAARVWHINADEPPLLDYNLEFGRNPGLAVSDSPYRSSDHDPVIVGIDL